MTTLVRSSLVNTLVNTLVRSPGEIKPATQRFLQQTKGRRTHSHVLGLVHDKAAFSIRANLGLPRVAIEVRVQHVDNLFVGGSLRDAKVVDTPGCNALLGPLSTMRCVHGQVSHDTCIRLVLLTSEMSLPGGH